MPQSFILPWSKENQGVKHLLFDKNNALIYYYFKIIMVSLIEIVRLNYLPVSNIIQRIKT